MIKIFEVLPECIGCGARGREPHDPYCGGAEAEEWEAMQPQEVDADERGPEQA